MCMTVIRAKLFCISSKPEELKFIRKAITKHMGEAEATNEMFSYKKDVILM